MARGEGGRTAVPRALRGTPDGAPGKAALVGRGLGWSLVSTVGLRLGSVALSIVVARLVSPAEYGVFAVALTVWMVLSTLAEFGLGSDLVRAQDPARRAPTVATLGIGIAGGTAATTALASPWIAESFHSPGSATVVAVMAIGIGLFGLTIVPAAMLQRAYRQRTLFVVNGAGFLAMVSTVVPLALLDVGPMALAWGHVASQATVVVGLYVATSSRPRLGLDGAVARESLAFCGPLALANVISWLLLTLDNMIVSRELSPLALGFYVLAFNVSSWPMSALGQAVRVVALPAFSDSGSRDARNKGLVRCVSPVMMGATAMGLTLATLAGPVVATLYGERWAHASLALPGLAVFGALRVVLDLLATFLIAAGDTRQVLVVQLVWLAAMIPSMVLGVRHWGLIGAGWVHVAVVLVVVLPAYAVCLRRAGVEVPRMVRASVVPVVAVIPAAVVCTWIGASSLPPVASLAMGLVAAAALYVLPLLPWFRRRIHDLRGPAARPALERTAP